MPGAKPERSPANGGWSLADGLQECLDGMDGVAEPSPGVCPARRRASSGPPGSRPPCSRSLFFLVSIGAPRDKSIAVLPFRNLSEDPANAFFAEGDPGRHSFPPGQDPRSESHQPARAARYPADLPRDLPAIGRALGVRHVVEGSLRRSGDRVFLHVALIDTTRWT